jgi:hypothetical protein
MRNAAGIYWLTAGCVLSPRIPPRHQLAQAYWINAQVTAFPSYGGIRLPLAMGAVVDGLPTTRQTPLSGQTSPVLAVVPIGAFTFDMVFFLENRVMEISFNIDNGELDGVSPQECFVLGYEVALIDHLLASGDAINQPVHADNRQRIETRCHETERPFRLTWMPGDESESWMQLEMPAQPNIKAA